MHQIMLVFGPMDGAMLASLQKPQHVFQDASLDVHLASMCINPLCLCSQEETSCSDTP